MKKRIIGIDTGTNSLGWAIVDYDDEREENKYTLVDRGVNIFQEGVKIEKGIESSRAAERTLHKHQRVGYWRRKTRKIALIRLLRAHNLCPYISDEELKQWRSNKIYPKNEAFMSWLSTDDKENDNPYYYRNLCLAQTLDMSLVENRYKVGRAIYHLNQRRGFLSNRKQETKESDGVVTQDIGNLSQSIQEEGYEYLGQYFFAHYGKDRLRAHYTSRLDHYEKELLAICHKQGIDQELTSQLRRVIITQRPLKSQKHTVGRCVFEPKKTRCPASHPLYEQYRMYAFINNIEIQTPYEEKLRHLTSDERKAIIPLFLRRTKTVFKFEEIAKKLSGGKNNFCYYKDKTEKPYKFNYYMDTSVSGCPVIAQLTDVFGVEKNEDAWIDAAREVYVKAAGKTEYEVMNDIWHALFFFEEADKLKVYAKENLQMNDEEADKFSKIKLPSDYAALSLKAIRKILPYMKRYELIYSRAVFLANLPHALGLKTDGGAALQMLPEEDAEDVVSAFKEYDPKNSELTCEAYVKKYIAYKYNLDEEGEKKLNLLYHPSMIETFPKVRQPEPEGYFQLGSPRTNALRNPMAMHSLFRLRHVLNTLLKEGKIDKETTIRIEFSRNLNDANKRAAIRQWQNDNESKNKEYAQHIKEHFGGNYVPTRTDILKYRLWEDQNHLCPYTGHVISLSDLFDGNKYDIEHTIPRSAGGDSTVMNLTLCDSRFNRETKGVKIPTELDNYEDIMERIQHWKTTYEKLEKEIRKKSTRGVSEKEIKDRMIQKRHRLTLERDYWKGKYTRFTMKEVPEGFSRRQGVDISVISKYALAYLRSLFRNIYVVKGISTSDFRKIWGLQEVYEKKSRDNHCHHAIDAITIACIGKAEYDELAGYYHDAEEYEWGQSTRQLSFPKPWATFTEDVKDIEKTLIVSHYSQDNVPKKTFKRIRINGKLARGYMRGDTARGSLHLDTYYGAIEHEGEVKYVVRKPLDDNIKCKDIVDNAVRQKVEDAIKEHGSLKKAVEAGIWMNKEKGIKINKVRVFASHIKNPINIRRQRDVSPKEYKQTYHVANDTNYMMGIYVGRNSKGKVKTDFELINTLNATMFFNSGAGAQGLDILPDKSRNSYPLKYRLKIGTMVLLYEETPEEIYELDKAQLCKRLYKITGMSSMNISGNNYGRIYMVHHQVAKPASEIKFQNGKYCTSESLREGIMMLHTQFQALIQHQDFEINDIGEIKFRSK